MSKKELISLLLYDVALEHSAIVQYLYHIFLITDANITSEIEEIARQEMRHLKWFAQKVVQLGGEVVLDRLEDMIMVGGPDWADMLSKDVLAEEMAIEIYTKQLDVVKDDSVKRLLERVIKDENTHKFEFSELRDKVKEGMICYQEERQKVDQKTLEVLNKFLQEEYASIIKYLYQFFHSKDINHRDVMLDIAIESMVHMGKIGEKIGELGGMPNIKTDLSPIKYKGMQESLKEDIAFEQQAMGEYEKDIKSLADPEIKRLFEFIEHQEEYHRHMLMELFKKMRKLTVGDLRKSKDD
ncbi:ferritin-like domain-containing protein [Thermocrinis jamiesonii]|jgi:Mn-containing catalase|uniref:ferritin-like domain-containing protein n=1 Tax=Thermocrinis jamiesonii TaxID=1302351 RepID=UPI0004957BE1|nr:ferritin-like domain-containing protein [Thermocrinis jamiesonii]